MSNNTDPSSTSHLRRDDPIEPRGIPPLGQRSEEEIAWDREQQLARDHSRFLNEHGETLLMTPKIKSILGVVIAALLLIAQAFLPAGTIEIIVQAAAGIAGAFGITGIREHFDMYKSAMKSKTIWGGILVIVGFLSTSLLPLLGASAVVVTAVSLLLKVGGSILGTLGLIQAIEGGVSTK